MKKTTVKTTPRFFLQLSVAAYFVLYGLVGIAYYDSGIASTWGRALVRVFGGRYDALSLIIAILTLISGVILALGLFLKIEPNLLYAAGLGIFIFWAIRMLYIFFVRDLMLGNFLVWLEQLALDLVVLAAVWLVTRKYS